MRHLAIHLLAWSAWALTTGCGTPYALSPDNTSGAQAQSNSSGSTGAPAAPPGQSQPGGSPAPTELQTTGGWDNMSQSCMLQNGTSFAPVFIGNLQFFGPSRTATPTEIHFTGYPASPAPDCLTAGGISYPTVPFDEEFTLTLARPDENGCMYYEGSDGSTGNKILAVDWSHCRNRSPEVTVFAPNGSRIVMLTYGN